MPANDPVRDLLRRKMLELSEQAASADGSVPSAGMDELNRLARLVEVRDKVLAMDVARWRLAALLLGALVLVSLLLFLRVRETEVELELVASEIGFTLARPQPLTELARLAELRATGLRDVQVSDSALALWASQPDVEPSAIRLATMQRNGSIGTVTLEPIALPERATVRVRESAPGAGANVAVSGVRVPLRVTVHGPVQVDVPNAEPREFAFSTPRSLVLETDSSDASLHLIAAPGAATAFATQLAIERLSLSRIDELQAQGGTTAQEMSTILSGTIFFEALNGQARALRASELLRFDEISGVVRTLRIEDDRVRMQFRGTVRGMRSGWGDAPANLMPSWLDWLRARHGLSLLWGTTLYLFGLAVAALRWWRVRI